MADALIPGYSLPEHLKSAKQIIPIDIDQTFENNYYKNPDEVLAYTKTPEGKNLWQFTNDYQRLWMPSLIKDYNLDLNANYFTFTLFSFKMKRPETKHYGVVYRTSTSSYEKTTDSDKQYGVILPSATIKELPKPYFPFYQFDSGVTSCEVTYAMYSANGVMPYGAYRADYMQPYIKFQVSGRKLSLFTQMDVCGHTDSQNNNPLIWLYYKTYYIQMQGVISIF